MSMRSQAATALFGNGFNCAQSVLSVFSQDYGLDSATAAKLACGLGGGIRCAEVCGAVSGAVLAIGLKSGQARLEDKDDKQACYALTKEFIARFRLDHGSIVCRDLLGYDISSPEGYAQAEQANLFNTTCVDIVRQAVLLLEEMGV